MDVLGIGFVRTLLVLLFFCVGGCESQEEGSVRIVGGPSPREGRVEIYFEDLWSTVSEDDWTKTEAVAVCRQLGFDGPAAQVEPEPAPPAMDIPTLSVNCPGGASSLTECQIQKTAGVEQEASKSYLDGLTYWDHSNIAGVKCENANENGVAHIVITVVAILIAIAVICLFSVLFYRTKKSKTNKPPEAVRQEQVAMYSTTIEKNYAEIGEDQAQPYITIDSTEVEQAQQYIKIDPSEVEPENSYETPKIKDPPEQTSA